MDVLDITKRAARPFGLAASLILVFMMLFTTVTVGMRQLLDYPVLGVVDMMELSMVGLIFIAMPGVFLRDENVTVDVIDHFVSAKVRTGLRLLGLAITLGLLLILFVSMIPQAMEKYTSGEVTMTLSIDRFSHWIPILIGFAASILATLWILVRYLRYGVPGSASSDEGPFG